MNPKSAVAAEPPRTLTLGDAVAMIVGIVIGVECIGQEHQHIHIRKWKQLAAPVTTHGQQGQGRRHSGICPELLQDAVGQLCQAAKRLVHIAPGCTRMSYGL